MQQQLFCLVQYMLDAQARQIQWIEKLTADCDRLADERDEAFRVAADEVAQRRNTERELVAARAHIDQLAAQVGALTTRIRELSPLADVHGGSAGIRRCGITIPHGSFKTLDDAAMRRGGTPPLVTVFSEADETTIEQFSILDAAPGMPQSRGQTNEALTRLGPGPRRAGSPVRASLAPLGRASTAATPPRRTAFKVLAITGSIAVLLAMAWLFWDTPGLPQELDYASGDRPAVDHESDSACEADACVPVITATTLTWKLAATRPAIDTELRAVDGKPGRTAIGGELVLSSTRCPGTTVAWTVSANHAQIATGVLTGNHRSQNLSYVTRGQLDDVTFQANAAASSTRSSSTGPA